MRTSFTRRGLLAAGIANNDITAKGHTFVSGDSVVAG
jgi:hypothetical protein